MRPLLLWLLCSGLISGQTLRLFVLTGQSNSLGTLATTDTTMTGVPAGADPIDAQIPFFWDNRADGTVAGDNALGDSGGAWVTLGPQTGGFYANNDDHWGPEVGFARMLWRAGYRDFAIVKASRGGGGNSFWVKGAADDHMYQHVLATVNAAVTTLPTGYTTHEVAGLLYVQGESNNSTEADQAATRFSALRANLQADLANAGSMKGVFGEIGGSASTNRTLTRSRQSGLANTDPEVGYASATGLGQHDGLHYDADSTLLLGERMAAEAIGAGCFPGEPLPAWGDLYAWFQSDSGVQGGAEVSRWADLADGSGARDLTRTVAGRPGFLPVTAAGAVRQALQFDGTADLWASSGEFGSLDGGRSVAVLCRVPALEDDYLFDGSTSTGRTRVQVRGGDWQAGVSGSWDAPEGVTAPLQAGVWQRHVWTFDEVGGFTEVSHWIDGVLEGTTSDVNSGSLRGFIVGSNGGSPFRPLQVDIAEVAVYGKVLDSTEVAALETSWQGRWGVIAGPPFGVTIRQDGVTVPRFGWHEVVELQVDVPAAGTTLDQVTLTLKPGTREQVSGVRFRAGGAVVATSGVPATDQLVLPVGLALLEGTNRISVELEPRRWAPLGSTLDAVVEALDFSGTEAGQVVPADGDPAGELTIGVVPLVSDVRRSGDFGITTYRIPGVTSDVNGVIHAVFDHRWTGGSDLPADIDVGYARSTDGGTSWSGFQPILDFDKDVPGSSGNGVGDPAILYDPVTDTLWVAALWSFGNNGYFGSGPGTDPADTGQYVLTKSEDGGQTWSAAINVTADVKADPNWRLIFQGPGHGLAMRDGTLVFPSQYIDASGVVRACSVYSDDHGVSWQFGSGLVDTSPQTNENTVCELDDGRLLFSARTPSGSNGQRAWAYYTPGGAAPLEGGSWTDIFRLASVPDPVCQGSVIQWTSALRGDPREKIAFVNPGSSSSRVNLTLRASGDGGASWPVSRLLYGGPSAYSSVCVLPDRTLGIFFEKDNYTRVTFMRVEEEWLWNPAVDTDGDTMPDGWEAFHGTDPGVADAALDPDGDGSSSGDEYRSGTDPLNGDSVLRLSVAAGSTPGELELNWGSVPGRGYLLQASGNLVDWEDVEEVTASEAQSTKTLPRDGSARFYRVGVF